MISSLAATALMPSNWPELISTSFAECSTNAPSPTGSPPAGATTGRIGRPYFWANSKSRWSCAGTPMTAPVPYSIST